MRLAEIQLVDHPLIAHSVDVAGFIGTKGDESLGQSTNLTNSLQLAVLLRHAKDPLRGIIAAHVHAVKRRLFIAAINKSTRDRDTVFPFVGEDRRGEGSAFL